MKEGEKKKVKEISLKAIVVSILFLIAIFSFAFLAQEIVLEKKDLFDSTVFNFFKPHSSPGFIQLMKALGFFGSAYFLLPAYVAIVIWLLWKRRKEDAINVGILGVSSYLLKTILKNIFHRERPGLPLSEPISNFSFPSGHALSSFIFCSVVIYLVWKGNLQMGWKVIFSIMLILFSFSIGISRIVLRYHFASDVIAGLCIGFAWVILSFWVENKITRKFKNRAK